MQAWPGFQQWKLDGILPAATPQRDHRHAQPLPLAAGSSRQHDAPSATAGGRELLIVDDGSDQPDALRILHRLKEHGLPVLHRPPKGLAAARNAGIRAAVRPVLPLDDDNRLLRPYLNTALQLLEHHPSVSLLYGDRIEFGVGATRRRIRPGPLDRNQLLQRNPIDACAIFRRSLWQRCGGYDEKLTALEDWDLWLTAAKGELKACYLPEPCFEYRIRENSMLRKHLNNLISRNSR